MKQEQLTQALRDMAATNLRLAQTIADIRGAIFSAAAPPGVQGVPEDEEPCPYCREGRSHTSELCRRSGGQG